jgi:hypothetical protein
MDRILFEKWSRFIPDLGPVLRTMQDKAIISVGVAPYPRIIPSFFLERYSIFSVKDASDLDILRRSASIFCLEEKYPKVAAKVRATGYLINNYAFHSFLKSRREPFRLLFYQTTDKIIESLETKGWDWIGNYPKSFADVILKGDFRDLVKKLYLPSIPDWRLSREEFLDKKFDELFAHWQRPIVVQRADFDVAGELGTFFLNNTQDWKTCHDILEQDHRYKTITISPFIVGNSLSMLGCVTPQGVLSSTLQLQLIDVPESLHGQLPTGVFLGHDWGYQQWDATVEYKAQMVVEEIGRHLASNGFRGIFGIDFLHDTKTSEIFPIECNPRFTGALPVYSLMPIANGIPPLELFHLMSHLDITAPFDFESVNRGLKRRMPLSHISLTPKGVYEMKMNLPAGIYSFNSTNGDLRYERPGAFYSDLKRQNEFILIDSVPRLGGRVIQNVARLCKLVFPRQIAQSSFQIDPSVGKLITNLSTELRKGQTPVNEVGDETIEEQ